MSTIHLGPHVKRGIVFSEQTMVQCLQLSPKHEIIMTYTQRANCFQCEQLDVFVRLPHEVRQCVAHLVLDVVLQNKTQ